MRILWKGPLTDPSGYAAEGRAFVRGLVEANNKVRVEPYIWHYREAITPRERERLADLMETPLPRVDASIQHTFGRLFDPYAPGRLRIGRTMFETDTAPADWLVRCRQMDEIWVPTAHNRDALLASGLDPERVAIVPSPLELDRIDADAEPLTIPEAHGTVFLAAFDWTLRKGWDVLLDAWCEAFRAADDVTLVLKAWSTSRGLSTVEIQEEALAHLRRRGHDPARAPDMVLLDRLLDERGMSRLYAACDAYVAPTRGEGWGRPLTEAMAAGRPVIATAWSGPTAYLDAAVGWPLGYDLAPVSAEAAAEVPSFGGARWAEPRREDLVAALRAVHERPAYARELGRAARDRVKGLDHRTVARAMLARLAAAAPLPRPRAGRPDGLPVVVEGPILASHSLAGVNRGLARALLRAPEIELALVDTQGAGLDVGADPQLAPLVEAVARLLPRAPAVTVRHQFPPSFAAPGAGRLVCVMPWEFGPVPGGWVAEIARTVDEVWVPSSWSREGYLESGVPAERVVVVPNGVDPERFRPGVAPLDLGDAAPGYRFLFVGGLLWRKGVDLLLEAYARAFTRDDDVTLVIKDFGALGPYVPQGAAERIAQLSQDPRAPRVAHFTGTLAESQMPSLYAACDCLVHPYRGEGYALPIAEAMAVGRPAIIPERGAARDYAGPGTAIMVPCETVQAGFEIGGYQLTDRARVVEVDVDALATAMRGAYERPDDARAVGAHAAAHIRRGHTWDHAAAVARRRLVALGAAGSRAA